tara:strand:- start:3790 stop:4419 length:630 start_codon:yes stop_codon:yes gene_type:complete
VKKNIEDYLFLKENFLEKDFCDHSIDILSKAPWKEHEFDKKSERLDGPLSDEDQVKESSTLDIDSLTNINNMLIGREIEKINTYIMENIPNVLMEYCTSFGYDWLRGWGGFSPVKHNRYLPGQEMKRHWDNVNSIFPGSNQGVITGIPFLTVIGFLTDDYKGGEMFLCDDYKINTTKGNILVHPSSFMFPHQILPITEGVRHSYVSWVY